MHRVGIKRLDSVYHRTIAYCFSEHATVLHRNMQQKGQDTLP